MTYVVLMNINNEKKLRLGFRVLCKAAKMMKYELEHVLQIVQEEWEHCK